MRLMNMVHDPLPAGSLRSLFLRAVAFPLLAIGPVAPAVTHAQATLNGTERVIYTSGTLQPTSVAIDAAGDAFFVDANSSSIFEQPAGGGSLVTVASGLSSPQVVSYNALGSDFTLMYTLAPNGLGVVDLDNISGVSPSPVAVPGSRADGMASVPLTAGPELLTV